MIIAIWSYLWLAWVSWTVEAHIRATDNGGLRCSFAVNDLEFDLCPLLKARAGTFDVSIDEETPPTRTQRKYAFGFGGSLKWDGTLPAELQCPVGTRICLTVINTRLNHPLEPSRILQIIPIAKTAGLDPKAKLGEKINKGDLHAPLQVTFHGGSYMRQTQKATFLFQCDPTAEPSTPSFLWQFNGTHAFSWKTKHACHKSLAGPNPHDPEPDPDPPQDPPKDPDSESGEKPAHHSIMSVIIWLAIPSLILSRLLYFWLCNGSRQYHLVHFPTVTQFNRFQSRSLRFFPWSQSPSRGVGKGYRADEAGSELEEVPYYDSYHEGEEMPLTPNARAFNHKRGAGQYGSF